MPRAPRPGPTPEAIEQALLLIEQGAFVSHACSAAGVSIKTWEKRVAADEAFAERVAVARDKGEVEHLKQARTDLENGHSTSHEQWLLERLNMRRFRPPPTETHVTLDDQTKSVWDALQKAAEREGSE